VSPGVPAGAAGREERAGGQLRRPNARYTPLDVPGPVPADMLRALPAIVRDPLAYLERVVARYGDLVAFPMPRGAVLLVNDPAGARRVLQDNPRNYLKHTVQYTALAAVTGQGLLVADGDVWRDHRRIVRPAFQHEALTGFAARAVEAGEELRAAWDAAGPARALDADAMIMRTMLRLVGRTLFSSDLEGEAARIVAAVDGALRLLVRRSRSPVPAGWPTPSRFRLRRAVQVLDAICADLVTTRRRVPGGTAPAGSDVLGLLLDAAGAGELTSREVRDEIVTLVIAGYETVASSLTWTLGLLADHPRVQDALAAELDDVLRDRSPGWADLPALRVTRAVVDESLRLYPPAWVVTRRAVAADELAGVRVPAGTLVILSPWLLHRRPADWPDPGHFDPGRFLGTAGAAARSPAPRATYLPFGLGPRLCIGRDAALVESVLMLATLLRGRRLSRPPGSAPPRPEALVTLRPKTGQPLLLHPPTPGDHAIPR
jgi:cytochrome P450